MGNTGGRRSKNDAVTEATASRCVVVTAARKQRRHDVDEEAQTARVGRRRRPAGGVPRAGDGDGGVAAVTGTVVTLKVVMTRKDAEALAARLNAQSARARKARMAELKGALRAGRDRGGGASPAPSCRDACWSPQLAPIKES